MAWRGHELCSRWKEKKQKGHAKKFMFRGAGVADMSNDPENLHLSFRSIIFGGEQLAS